MMQLTYSVLSHYADFRWLSNSHRKEEAWQDGSARELTDKIIDACKSYYSPGESVTINEHIIPFRGRIPFKVYIKGKPDPYGIKVILLCNVSMSYVLNAVYYIGKEDPPITEPRSEYCLVTLTEHLHGKKRCIVADNWFSSIPAAEKLLEKGLTFVGTLRKNKRQILKEILSTKDRPNNSAVFIFHEEITLIS